METWAGHAEVYISLERYTRLKQEMDLNLQLHTGKIWIIQEIARSQIRLMLEWLSPKWNAISRKMNTRHRKNPVSIPPYHVKGHE